MKNKTFRLVASFGLAAFTLVSFENCAQVHFAQSSLAVGTSIAAGDLVPGATPGPIVPGQTPAPDGSASGQIPSPADTGSPNPDQVLPPSAMEVLSKCAPSASASVVMLGQAADPAAQDLVYSEFSNLAPAHAVVASARNVVLDHPGSNDIRVQRSESARVFDFGGTLSIVTRKLISLGHLAGNATPAVLNAVEIGDVSDLGLDVLATGQTLSGAIDNAGYTFCLSVHDFAASAKVTAGRQFALLGRPAAGEDMSTLPLMQTIWGVAIVKDVAVEKIDGFSGAVVLINSHVHEMTNAWGDVTVYVHGAQIDQIDPSIKIVNF